MPERDYRPKIIPLLKKQNLLSFFLHCPETLQALKAPQLFRWLVVKLPSVLQPEPFLANTATNTNTLNTIVKRDANGDFSAGTISVSGLSVTGGTPGAGKVLTSDAIGNATWQSNASSLITEITRSRFQLTDINGAYILNGQSLGENNDITDYRNHFIAPYNGKLLKIVVKSEVAMGSTVIRMHIKQNSNGIRNANR